MCYVTASPVERERWHWVVLQGGRQQQQAQALEALTGHIKLDKPDGIVSVELGCITSDIVVCGSSSNCPAQKQQQQQQQVQCMFVLQDGVDSLWQLRYNHHQQSFDTAELAAQTDSQQTVPTAVS